MGNRTDHGYHPTTGNRYSSFRGDSASYDADGNFIQRFNPGNYTLNFYWSAESRLDSVEFATVKLARYDYNALGKPVVKYKKNYGGSWAVSSYFIWDGDQLLLELDSLGNRRADYTYFPGTIDQPAAQSIGATTVTTTRDFRFDATGSVIGTVDGTAVSQKVAYSQWGGPDFTGNSDNHLMWKGLLYNEDVAGLKITIYSTEFSRSFTLGHSIFLGRTDWASWPTIAHEMTHVVQYERLGAAEYLRQGLNARMDEFLGSGSPYAYRSELNGRSFFRYGMEQQGQLVQDCAVSRAALACGLIPFFVK